MPPFAGTRFAPWAFRTTSQPACRLRRKGDDRASTVACGLRKNSPDGEDKRGEGWLIISDFAVLLGLRSREELLAWIDEGGLRALGRIDTRPRHGKAADREDPLHAARSAEVTSLWRLGRK